VSEYSVLQEGRARGGTAAHRARRRRRRHVLLLAVLVIVLALAVLLILTAGQASGPGTAVLRHGPRTTLVARPGHRPTAVHPTYGLGLAPPAERVTMRKTFHLASGILFDVWTGRVLWQHNPGRRLPIASLTKMMTALLVVGASRPGDHVLITRQAVHFTGSGVGLLPVGKDVNMGTLLYGLLLPSGNDAAIALAQHVAGSQAAFVDLMNQRARAMGLSCTHFSSVSGIVDQNNYSCTQDLAVLAHAVLERPLLAQIVGSRSAVLPFPIKGGKLYLYNNNPLLVMRFPGVDGVKTGYTSASGPCLVATARRGHTWLGVVLLHSADTAGEAQKLLNAGFAKLRGT
jgi:serine-type D-Ala-D-Ala carboxypeptidase (penicillin-binding protein 5/6)